MTDAGELSPFLLMLLAPFMAVPLVLFFLRGLPPRLERKALLTEAELQFWEVLRAAVPGYTAVPQVAMGALLKAHGGQSRRAVLAADQYVARKTASFVMIRERSCHAAAVVELVDGDHDKGSAEAFEALLSQGGYPVVRFSGSPLPSCELVRSRLAGFGVGAAVVRLKTSSLGASTR